MAPTKLTDGGFDRPECLSAPPATVTKLSPGDVDQLLDALHVGVVPATGCTEPVALAFAAARARLALGLGEELPDDLRIEARVSRNIMKNGMAVMVPGTGLPGLEIAAAIGVVEGDPNAGLGVLAQVTEDGAQRARRLVDCGAVRLSVAEVDDDVYAEAVLFAGGHRARVCIAGDHTNAYLETRDDEVLVNRERPAADHVSPTAKFLRTLTLAQLVDFAHTVDLGRIEFIADAERLNSALVVAGRDSSYGVGVGAAMLGAIESGLSSDDLCSMMTAQAAAASDARMGGAPLPAMTNSGSGNQGIVATVPVIVAADRTHASRELRLRALTLSHAVALYAHAGLPVLSAFCAAATAAMGAAAGVCFILDGSYESIERAVSSMAGDTVGMVCDGAGCSCALKVAASVNAAGRAVVLSLAGRRVPGTNGLVHDDVDASLRGIGRLATHGMKETDSEILSIMMAKSDRQPY